MCVCVCVFLNNKIFQNGGRGKRRRKRKREREKKIEDGKLKLPNFVAS